MDIENNQNSTSAPRSKKETQIRTAFAVLGLILYVGAMILIGNSFIDVDELIVWGGFVIMAVFSSFLATRLPYYFFKYKYSKYSILTGSLLYMFVGFIIFAIAVASTPW